MPTYVYETIPAESETAPRTFELKQSMNDAALTHDPATGEPVRRVVSGGYGYLATGSTSGTPARAAGGGGHGCGSGCGCGA